MQLNRTVMFQVRNNRLPVSRRRAGHCEGTEKTLCKIHSTHLHTARDTGSLSILWVTRTQFCPGEHGMHGHSHRTGALPALMAKLPQSWDGECASPLRPITRLPLTTLTLPEQPPDTCKDALSGEGSQGP